MKTLFGAILIAINIGTAAAQLKNGNMVFVNLGGNTFEEFGMDEDYDVAAMKFTFQGRLYLMSKATPYVGIRLTAGFNTIGINQDYYARKFGNASHNSFEYDLRLSPIVTVGPVIFIRSKLVDVCIEPALGIVGALSPNLTHIYQDENLIYKTSWKYSSAKPALGATVGIGLYRKITDKLVVSASAEYAFAKSWRTVKYSEYALESDDNGDPSTTSVTSNIPKSTSKECFMFSVGLGFYLPEVKSKETTK